MNALIGYLLLHNQERSGATMLTFFVAMLVKFVVNDHGLHSLHNDRYDNVGRWLLATAVTGGWGLRALHRFSDAVPVALQAILSGAALLNVLKEELPSERQSRYWAFLTAGLAYAAFLVVVPRLRSPSANPAVGTTASEARQGAIRVDPSADVAIGTICNPVIPQAQAQAYSSLSWLVRRPPPADSGIAPQLRAFTLVADDGVDLLVAQLVTPRRHRSPPVHDDGAMVARVWVAFDDPSIGQLRPDPAASVSAMAARTVAGEHSLAEVEVAAPRACFASGRCPVLRILTATGHYGNHYKGRHDDGPPPCCPLTHRLLL